MQELVQCYINKNVLLIKTIACKSEYCDILTIKMYCLLKHTSMQE